MVFQALKDNILISANSITFKDKQNRGYIFNCIEKDCCNGKLQHIRETKKEAKHQREAHFRHEKNIHYNTYKINKKLMEETYNIFKYRTNPKNIDRRMIEFLDVKLMNEVYGGEIIDEQL
jgi:hypothetical protein